MHGTHGRLATLLFAGTAVQSSKKDAPLTTCRLKKLQRPIKNLISKHNGYLLEISDSELFAYFHSPRSAFRLARILQKEFTGEKGMCSLRIGLHVGEVQINKKHVYGNDVNIASRLMERARPGGICLSQPVYQYVQDRTSADFVSLGMCSLRNIDGKINLYAVLPKRDGTRFDLHRIFHQMTYHVRSKGAWLVVVALLAGAVSLWQEAGGSKFIPDEHVSYLSVAAFRNLNPGSVPEYLNHGIEDAVKSQLASVPGLYLVPEDNRVGATVQLRVSLQQVATRLRAAYRIVNLADGIQLAGEVVEGDRADLFHLQDKLADAIVADLAGVLALNDMELVRPNMTEDNKAYAYYLQAREYLDMPGHSGNIGYASRLFEAALAVDPGFARAMAGLCEVHWLEYEQDTLEASADKAEQSCRKARRLDPQLVDVQLALGRLYEGKGQHDKAVSAFKHALEIDPRSDQAYRGLSRVYLSRNQTEKALSTYAKAINLHPGYWLNYKELGNLHVRAGHYDEAIRWYREALELTPDNAEVHASLGLAMAMKGEFQQALAAYSRSIALEPTAAALTNMGDAYYHTGNYAQAFLMHQRAVEKAPGNFLGWLNLGNTRQQLYAHDEGTDQIYDKVVELARRSLVVNPRNASAWLAIALAKARLKQNDEAILSMRRGLELSAGNLAMRYQSAVVWSAMGDAERALDIIEELLAEGISARLIESDPALKNLTGSAPVQVLVDAANTRDKSRF